MELNQDNLKTNNMDIEQIKFRGLTVDETTMKSNKKSKWVYGYYEYDCYGSCHFISVIDLKPELSQYNILVDPKTVGQFTMVKDIDGIKIYKGDIISYTQHHFNTEMVKEKVKEVKWNRDRWNIYETQAGESNIKVIGNIYENKELLK